MQRSYSLRCRCFVTPGAVSSCKAIVEQEICTVWNVLGSPFKQFKALIPRGSVTMLHFRSVYCFSSPLFCLFIRCLQPSSPGPLLFYFYFCCLPFYLSLFSVKARVSISNGMLFLRNKSVRWAVYPASFASLLQACISHLG